MLQSFGAIWRLGAIVAPVNYMMKDDEIASIYENSGAEVVISVTDFLPKIQAGKLRAPKVKTVILVNDDVPEVTYSFHALINNAPETKEIAETDDDDVAAVIYSAGGQYHQQSD